MSTDYVSEQIRFMLAYGTEDGVMQLFSQMLDEILPNDRRTHPSDKLQAQYQAKGFNLCLNEIKLNREKYNV